jgi:predicted phosphatase
MNLLDFDSIVLDLDYTIWDGSKDNFWAKSLKSPYYLDSKNRKIIDCDNNFLHLQNNVEKVLEILYLNNKKISFITLGGLLNTELSDQPPIKCLEVFNLLNFFNFKRSVLYKTDLKSSIFTEYGKTIFIDDKEDNLIDIKKHFPNTECLNRDKFNKWDINLC